MEQKLELIATMSAGLESITAQELRDLGYEDLIVENGRITFTGDEFDICRTNLWLRTADRILIKMGEFEALTFEDLFEGTKALPWPDWIPVNGEFPVQGRSHKSQLSSVPACQSIVKKAIAEKMKERYNVDWFPEDGSSYAIEVSLLKDRALLTLDTTGASLHKRGYRKLVTEAPLKETMAAAMIYLSRWNPERPLLDPFCGSGTIPIEAAMIGWNLAPGLRRTFAAESWERISKKLWQRAREEAIDLCRDDIPLQITGSDIDPAAIDVAQASLKKAGLSSEIKLSVLPFSKVKPSGDYGCLITNPPYGERIGAKDEVDEIIRSIGKKMKQYPTWSQFILSATPQFERLYGKKADKNRKLYNGRILTRLYQYFGPLPPKD